MKRGKRISGVVLSAVMVAVVIAIGLRLWDIHQTTSGWTLWPKAVPSKVQFANRDYQCGPNPTPETRSLDGLTKEGSTIGGADIYATAQGPHSGPVTWVVLKTDKATYTCDLLGGP